MDVNAGPSRKNDQTELNESRYKARLSLREMELNNKARNLHRRVNGGP